MYQSDTEILFPMRVAPNLCEIRGPLWQDLVAKVMQEEDASPNQLALSLMMIRLNSCLTCHTDSYRAMRGCTICASQVIRRFKGDDEDLLILFEQAKRDVESFLQIKQERGQLQELIQVEI